MTATTNPTVSVFGRLGARDFVTTGVFTTIMFLVTALGAPLSIVPVLLPLMAVVMPICGGIPFMLFAARVRRFGMITIMGTVLGTLLALMGHGIFVFATGIVFGLLGDLVAAAGRYRSLKFNTLAYGVFSIWLLGNFMPIVLTRDAYYAKLASGRRGVGYADRLMAVMPDWSLAPLAVACFVSGLLGAWLGRAMLRKHFERAGLA
ncbi:MptD family putative ECF transporter S component [Bifidobacterium choloepi]|nr:MptD family putative ECF transporter S component [Bifidobacterium choloepi]